MKNISWKKGFFKCAFNIFSEGQKIGELKPSKLTLSATGKIDQERYRFRVREGMTNRVEIIDMDTQEQVGKIRFGHWLPKATIQFREETYTWKFSNLWETRWKITDTDQNAVNYKGWACAGSISSDAPASLLTLTGLFISNYYWQMAAIYVAIFLPALTLAWV